MRVVQQTKPLVAVAAAAFLTRVDHLVLVPMVALAVAAAASRELIQKWVLQALTVGATLLRQAAALAAL